MGCDGGTIPTRSEQVRTKKKPEQKDKDSVRLYRWQHCRLSQTRLVKPIVACELGRMYNKEAIIEKLLNDKSEGDNANSDGTADHIKSLKDVKELQLTDNTNFDIKSLDGPSVGDGYVDRLVSPWICPITGLEMNGKFRFVFDWSDGRVMSDRAIKIVAKDEASKFDPENVIVINPEENSEEEQLMRDKMEARRAKAKAEKKAAKESKKRSSNKTTEDEKQQPEPSTSKKSKHSKDNSDHSAKNGSTSGKRKPVSVQEDETKSEVFKSLFSSHPTALNKPKGHWVTFDPRYN